MYADRYEKHKVTQIRAAELFQTYSFVKVMLKSTWTKKRCTHNTCHGSNTKATHTFLFKAWGKSAHTEIDMLGDMLTLRKPHEGDLYVRRAYSTGTE